MKFITRCYVFKFHEFKDFLSNNTEQVALSVKEDFLFVEQDAKDTDFVVFKIDSMLGTLLPDSENYEYFLDEVEEYKSSRIQKYCLSFFGTQFYFVYSNTKPKPQPPFNTKEIFSNVEHKTDIHTVTLNVSNVPLVELAAFAYNDFKHVNIECSTPTLIRFSIPIFYPKPAQRGVIQNE